MLCEIIRSTVFEQQTWHVNVLRTPDKTSRALHSAADSLVADGATLEIAHHILNHIASLQVGVVHGFNLLLQFLLANGVNFVDSLTDQVEQQMAARAARSAAPERPRRHSTRG